MILFFLISYEIILKDLSFDPLIKVPERITKYEKGDYYVLQFYKPLLEDERKDYEKKGVKFYAYIPKHAFLIYSKNISSFKNDKRIRWIGDYSPLFKINPSLFEKQSPEKRFDEDGRIKILIEAFPEVPLEEIIGKLKNKRILKKEKGVYFNYLLISIDTDSVIEEVESISKIKGIKWIERYYSPRLHNAWIRWVCQSFDTLDMGSTSSGWFASETVDATATPVYSHNIFGQGQIVGIADTGIDWDSRYFNETILTMNFNPPGTTFAGNYSYKIAGYQTLSDDRDGATNNEHWTGSEFVGTTGHGTHTSSTIAGDSSSHNPSLDGVLARGDGIAPLALIAFQDVSTTPSDQYNGTEYLDGIPLDLNNLFLWAFNAGARIHSNSWGEGTNQYNTSSEQCDQFLWDHPDFLILFSAGNDGPSSYTVKAPSTAKGVVTVGASQAGAGCNNSVSNYGYNTVWSNPGYHNDEDGLNWTPDGVLDNDLKTMAWFSSHGPTYEGLLKPDISVPGGYFIYSAWSDGDPYSGNPGTGISQGGTSNGTYLAEMGGTSMSCPAASGLSALIRQYYTDGFYPNGERNPSNSMIPSGALIKATLIAATRNITGKYTADNGSGNGNAPSMGEGWGLVVLDDALYFSGDSIKLFVDDNRTGISNSGTKNYILKIDKNSSQSLKIVLCWMDYPGIQSTTDPLVNDLNLTVTNGSNTYKGNVFSSGYSITGGSYDNKNPVEVVWIKSADYQDSIVNITVEGYEVNYGPQPYALVVRGPINQQPKRPEIFLPFNFEVVNNKHPKLKFLSIDPDNDNLEFKIFIAKDYALSQELDSEIVYGSSDTIEYTLSKELMHDSIYFIGIQARDFNGSNIPSPISEIISIKIDTTITIPFWSIKGYEQLNLMDLNRLVVSGDTLILPYNGIDWLTPLNEGFQGKTFPPAGWVVVDGNNNNRKWVRGSPSTDLGDYIPPQCEGYVAQYSDDDAGTSDTTADERLITPFVNTQGADSMIFTFGIGYRENTGFPQETVYTYLHRFISGSRDTIVLRCDLHSIKGNLYYDLSNYLPSDSVRIEFRYLDGKGKGYATSVDNVLLNVKMTQDYTSGYAFTPVISYDKLKYADSMRTNWGYIVYRKSNLQDSIILRVQYPSGDTFANIPEQVLPGNTSGFFAGKEIDSIDISGISPIDYDSIRIRMDFIRENTKSTPVPKLLEISVGVPKTSGIEEIKNDFSIERVITGKDIIFKVNSDKEKMIKISIIDISGRRLFLKEEKISKGLNRIIIENRFKNGVYFLIYETEREKGTRRFINIK